MISLLRGSEYTVAKPLAIGNAEISLARLVYKSIKSNQNINYRKLNAFTKKDRYPLSLINKTLTRITRYKYLTKIDIIAAFNLFYISLYSEALTTFITNIRAYIYKVMLFGLINGPATW